MIIDFVQRLKTSSFPRLIFSESSAKGSGSDRVGSRERNVSNNIGDIKWSICFARRRILHRSGKYYQLSA
jgi:hypothetical protein